LRTIARVIVAVTVAVGGFASHGDALQSPSGAASPPPDTQTLADAQRLFYNGRYDRAAAVTLALSSSDSHDLAVYELRTSALLFQLKRALGDQADKNKAFKQCAECQPWMEAFLKDIARGQAAARARLVANPADESALFFLGKLDLNYVWLQLGTLGRKTGWDEYWEARKSLDAVLKRNPQHVRARVARAWIDYIVDTKMPRGTRWLLGGGSRKRALTTVRDAVGSAADDFVQAEAEFALWDLNVRERKLAEAIPIARGLARDFPDNVEIAKFLETHDPDFRRNH
jgi:tetratricopeptide (TPR) repeat protein